MAKTLSVTINGKEYVSGEAKKAETSLISLKDISHKAMQGLELGAKAASAAFVGITTAVGAVTAATVKSAEMGDRVDKLSQKIGLSREAFQEWDYILGQNGMEIDKLQTSMKTLSDAAMEASLGSETYSRTFDALGVSVTDASGTLKSQEQLFTEVITAMTELDNATQRTALASDLFGRSATELAPILNAGAGSIEDLRARAHELGLVMNNETVDASVVLLDTIDDLKRSFGALGTEALAPLMPVLTEVTEAFIGMLKGDEGSFDAFGESIGNFLNTAIESIVTMAPKLVETGGQILGSLIAGISNNTDQIATAVTNILIALVDFVTANLPTVIGAAVKIVVALGQGLVQAIPNMAYSIWEMITGMINEVMKYVPNFILLGQNLIAGLVQGVKDWASNAVESVKNVGQSVIDGFKNLFGIHSPSTVFAEFGRYFMEGLAQGITDNDGLVSTALAGIGMPLDGGSIDVNVTGGSGGLPVPTTDTGGALGGIGELFASLGGTFGQLMGTVSSVTQLLNPWTTILGAMMEVLGPVIDQVLAPLVGILKVVGHMFGAILTPVIELLIPPIQHIAEAFVWIYNKVFIPIGNGLITAFNFVFNGIAGIYNGIAAAVNKALGWAGVNMKTIAYKEANTGHLSEIDSAMLTEAGSSVSGSSYTGGGSGSSTSVQSVNINIYQTFNGNVIGDGGLESVGEFIVSAIAAYSGVGGAVRVVPA